MSEPEAELPPTVPIQAVGRGDRPGLHVRLFGTSAFFRLWLAQVVSAIGDWLGLFAITYLATRVGGGSSGTAVGLVMTARILPGFFLASVAGVMIDRLDRKKVMVICDIGRAAVMVLLPFVDTVLGLVVASLVLEIGTLLWSPAKEASVPNLVPTDRLTSANSLSLVAAYGTMPLAAGLFALLALVAKWLGGIEALDALEADQETLAFYVDAATFLTSALIISTLALPDRRRERRPDVERRRIDWGQTYHELKEGWSLIFVNPVVRAVNVGLATGLVGGGMIVPLGSVFSVEVLGAGPAGYGVFVFALGLGVAFGVLGLSVVQNRVPKDRAFALSLLVAGGALIGVASMSRMLLAAVGVGVLGICAGSVYVLGFTLLHENVEDELRGRIFSALYTLVRLCVLVSFAVGPFLSGLLDSVSSGLLDDRRWEPLGLDLFLPGVRLTLWLAGAIILLAGALAVRSLRATRVAAGRDPGAGLGSR